mgnify:CR=1 FL=1
MRLRYVLLLQILTCLVAYHMATKRIDEAYVEGVSDGVTAAKKFVMDKDKVCPGWLFQSNLKEAKAKICGRGRG